MIVKKQRELIIENVCGAEFSRLDLISALLWYSDKPLVSHKKVFISGRYPAVSIYREKVHLHRILMMWWLKRKLKTREHVHHRDGNRLNNLQENLELLSASDHQRLTNVGRKQSPIHVRRRINATCKTRYGHTLYESPELLEKP